MKKHKFNRMALALIVVAMMCSVMGTVFAEGVDDAIAATETVSPRYVVLKSFFVDLSISTSGRATCSAEANVNSSYTVVITTELQQNDGGWHTIKSQVSNEGIRVNDNMIYYVCSGSDYRVFGTARVYDSKGNCIETVTVSSNVISY